MICIINACLSASALSHLNEHSFALNKQKKSIKPCLLMHAHTHLVTSCLKEKQKGEKSRIYSKSSFLIQEITRSLVPERMQGTSKHFSLTLPYLFTHINMCVYIYTFCFLLYNVQFYPCHLVYFLLPDDNRCTY